MTTKFKAFFERRKSAMNFVEDFEMNTMDFDSIFALVRTSPSSFNLQPTRYLVIMDKEEKQYIKSISRNQHKLSTASGVVIVLADKDFMRPKNVEEIYRPSVNLGAMKEDELEGLKELLKARLEELERDNKLTEELLRTVSINVGFLLLAASSLGFDTCPLHVINSDKLRERYNIPDNLEPMLMVTVGRAVDKERPRSYKRPIGELVQYGKYN